MNIRMMLATSLALLGMTAPAHAVNMYAGPLFPAGTDLCECELVNITTAAKSVRIQLLNSAGQILNDTGTVSLGPGKATFVAGGSSGLQYCKFTNATPTYFRGTIACYGNPDSSDNVAAPAQ